MINQQIPMAKSFRVNYDMCTEGCNDFWEAHALIVKEAQIDPAEIWNVEYKGDAPNAWPMIEVTFQSIEVAKSYTCVYLGLGPIDGAWDVYTDDEVNEYLSDGEFVG
jgi:hypothetical protein